MKKRILAGLIVIVLAFAAYGSNSTARADSVYEDAFGESDYESTGDKSEVADLFAAYAEKLAGSEAGWSTMEGIGDEKAITDAIKTKAEEVTAGCTSDYDKARAVHLWIANNIIYDYDLANAAASEEDIKRAQAVTMYEKKLGVCAGIAQLYEAMLTSLNIPCLNVFGCYGICPYYNTPKDYHAWNVMYVDNRVVWADPTFDTVNTCENGVTSNGTPKTLEELHYFDFDPDSDEEKANGREYWEADINVRLNYHDYSEYTWSVSYEDESRVNVFGHEITADDINASIVERHYITGAKILDKSLSAGDYEIVNPYVTWLGEKDGVSVPYLSYKGKMNDGYSASYKLTAPYGYPTGCDMDGSVAPGSSVNFVYGETVSKSDFAPGRVTYYGERDYFRVMTDAIPDSDWDIRIKGDVSVDKLTGSLTFEQGKNYHIYFVYHEKKYLNRDFEWYFDTVGDASTVSEDDETKTDDNADIAVSEGDEIVKPRDTQLPVSGNAKIAGESVPVQVTTIYQDAVTYTGKKIKPATDLSAHVDFTQMLSLVTLNPGTTDEQILGTSYSTGGKKAGDSTFYAKITVKRAAKNLMSADDLKKLKKLVSAANTALKGNKCKYTINKASLTDCSIEVHAKLSSGRIKIKKGKLSGLKSVNALYGGRQAHVKLSSSMFKITEPDADTGTVRVTGKNNFTGAVTVKVVK